MRSRDTHYPYRQDSDFSYLTGFPEPEAVLVLVPGRKHGETLLFCRERDPEREAGTARAFGPEGAVEAFGFDDAYPISDLDDILPGLLEGRTRVYYHFGRDQEFDLKLIGWLNRVRAMARQGAQPPHEFLELGHLLDEMRLFKDRDELKLMQRAADITVLAHEAAMRAARAGMREYELQAEIERVFRSTTPNRPTAASSAPAVTPASCITAPTMRRPTTATWCWSTQAPSTAVTPPTSPAPSRSTAASTRSSVSCTTWWERRSWQL